MMVFKTLPDYLIELWCKYWHRPNNYLPERWNFFKKFSLIFIIGVIILATPLLIFVEQPRLGFIGIILLIISIVMNLLLPKKLPLNEENWWLGIGSKWDIITGRYPKNE